MKLCRTIFVDPPRSSASKLTNKIIVADAAEMLRRESMNLIMFPVSRRFLCIYDRSGNLLTSAPIGRRPGIFQEA